MAIEQDMTMIDRARLQQLRQRERSSYRDTNARSFDLRTIRGIALFTGTAGEVVGASSS
jgi:hypothetical protein